MEVAQIDPALSVSELSSENQSMCAEREGEVETRGRKRERGIPWVRSSVDFGQTRFAVPCGDIMTGDMTVYMESVGLERSLFVY